MAKTYIDGMTCKAVNGQFGEFFNISINLEKLQQYANEKGYVNVVMNKRREVGQYGETHYFTLNEWTPNNQSNNDQSSSQQNMAANNANYDDSATDSGEISIEDIPF